MKNCCKQWHKDLTIILLKSTTSTYALRNAVTFRLNSLLDSVVLRVLHCMFFINITVYVRVCCSSRPFKVLPARDGGSQCQAWSADATISWSLWHRKYLQIWWTGYWNGEMFIDRYNILSKNFREAVCMLYVSSLGIMLNIPASEDNQCWLDIRKCVRYTKITFALL